MDGLKGNSKMYIKRFSGKATKIKRLCLFLGELSYTCWVL